MPNFQQITSSIDVAPLTRALEAKPHLFGQRTERAKWYGSPHTQMSDIWVRYNDPKNLAGGNRAAFNAEHDSVWYPVIDQLPEIKPIAFQLMALAEGERLGGILITKIPPGGEIGVHVDTGWHAGYYEKFYVPVKNGMGAVFGFPDGVIQGREGCAYWFRNDVPHWVKNGSSQDRIAMIVCIKSDKYKGLRA